MHINRLAGFLLVSVLLPAAGCAREESSGAEDVKVELALQPDPPKVGPATATIKLSDKDGRPIKGATLKLEGNMNHAGMKPVFADANEVDTGKYEGTLDFNMAGDWFVLVTGTLPDGRKLKRKIDVAGVGSR
jgi:hypothetical protein